MDDHTDSEALAILRRLEPVLHDLQRDVVEIKVAVARKPDRSELLAMMAAMVGLFTLALGGVALLLRHF